MHCEKIPCDKLSAAFKVICMRKDWLLLACVVILGAVLRFAALAHNPPELFSDELDSYVSMKSIVMTGHDIDGSLKPFLYSRIMRNAPMYGVACYFSSLVWGNGPFGLRFPAAIFGIGVIILTYAIVAELTRRRKIALWSALLIAIQPLFIHFSRVAWEPASVLPFLLGGLYVLLRELRFARENGTMRFGRLALAALLLAMTVYTYASAWFYVVILVGSLVFLSLPLLHATKEYTKFIVAVILCIMLALPAIWMLFFDSGASGRMFSMVSGWLSISNLHGLMLLYLAHFNWHYLVSTGDGPNVRIQRELGGFGALFWWMIPLLAIGTINVGRYVSPLSMRIWVWLWLAAYPLGGTVAVWGAALPNAGRTLPGAPILCIIAALGLAALFEDAEHFASVNGKAYLFALRGVCAACACVSVTLFCAFYFVAYPRLTAPGWESGTGAAFEAVRKHSNGFSRVCFSGFNYYFLSGYIHYYIDDLPLQKLETGNNTACYQPGTLLVTLGSVPPELLGFVPISNARSVDGSVYAVVEARNP
jgi:Dolichyl-phosphate-mannose-protein mannosyltransferase